MLKSELFSTQPKIHRIIEISDPQIQPPARNRIQQKLIEDAAILIQKKKREDQIKQRIQQIQRNIEINREQKLKKMEEKEQKSVQVISKNKHEQNQKFKQHEQYFQQILNKNNKKIREDFRRAMSKQKEFSMISPSKDKKIMSTSKFEYSNLHKVHGIQNEEDFHQKLQKIEMKTQKAQKNHNLFNMRIVDRLKQKSQSITSAQKKALNQSLREQAKILQNCYKKVQLIQHSKSSLKSERSQQKMKKTESFKSKLQKYNTNLQNISYQDQQKFDKLQTKFNRKVSPKQWKDKRLQKYLQICQDNNKALDLERESMASKIIQKHWQITQQNKVYKSKRQKLLQAIKHN